jgi:hypothetical protein
MFKKVVQRGRSEVHGAMKKERHACARRRDGEPGVSWVEASFIPYVEPLRFTPRRIRHGTPVNAAEMVRQRCLARTKLADFSTSC